MIPKKHFPPRQAAETSTRPAAGQFRGTLVLLHPIAGPFPYPLRGRVRLFFLAG